MFSDKTILITGGSGSFGKAFIEHILINENFKKIIMFSRSGIRQDIAKSELGYPDKLRCITGDIRDKDKMEEVLYGVDYVIHAAAEKSLPSCEYNPTESIDINVNGTITATKAAIKCGVEKFLLISTDKAVQPINTYGKSKMLAEDQVIKANNYSANHKTKFAVCRWGNIVGSAGSIVPVWRSMIKSGIKVLPVTHADMTRYWYKMDDAVNFVLESLKNLKAEKIYIPNDMPSVRIIDLAAAFDMPYEIVGIRPGEKIHESIIEGCDSGGNPNFLTVEEIRQSIKE